VSTDQPETPTNVTIILLGYRARCTEPGCGNLGRMILRYADAGGRPMSNSEFSMHTLARDRALGLKVYDEREAS
jgi:hypothetical protein